MHAQTKQTAPTDVRSRAVGGERDQRRMVLICRCNANKGQRACAHRRGTQGSKREREEKERIVCMHACSVSVCLLLISFSFSLSSFHVPSTHLFLLLPTFQLWFYFRGSLSSPSFPSLILSALSFSNSHPATHLSATHFHFFPPRSKSFILCSQQINPKSSNLGLFFEIHPHNSPL